MGASSSNIEQLPCFTCKAVLLYQERSGEYIQTISETMLTPMTALFVSVAALWVVIQAYKLLLGIANPFDIAREFFFLSVSWIFLNSQAQGLIITVFNTTIDIMGSAASVVLQDSIDSSETARNASGLSQLVAVSELGMRTILNVGWAVAASWTITNPLTILYALFLIIPYFILMIIFFSHVVVAIFRVMVVSAFSPFLILAFGFSWGREMAYAGLRTLLSSIMVLFAASLALGSIMYGVSSLDILEPGKDIASDATFANPEFFLAVALGWMGSAFMTEAVGIANSITGSALSNTSIGILTAGMASTAMAVAAKSPIAAAVVGKGASLIQGGPDGIAQEIENIKNNLLKKYRKG